MSYKSLVCYIKSANCTCHTHSTIISLLMLHDLFEYKKDEALQLLRDTMATMMFEQIEKHSTPLKRAELTDDIHLDYIKTRMNEFLRVKWTRDMWDEELTVLKDKAYPLPHEVIEFADYVRPTCANVSVLAPVLVERERYKLYDFNTYMHGDWKTHRFWTNQIKIGRWTVCGDGLEELLVGKNQYGSPCMTVTHGLMTVTATNERLQGGEQYVEMAIGK